MNIIKQSRTQSMPVRRLGAGHAQHLTCERAYSGYEIDNKVETELRVVQFWTEIKLVITNRTPASRSSGRAIL